MIWCTNEPNAHIRTFGKHWSFTWRSFFPVSIYKYKHLLFLRNPFHKSHFEYYEGWQGDSQDTKEFWGFQELYEWFWKVWEGPEAPVSPRWLWNPRTGSHFSIMPCLLRINLVKSLVWDLSRLSFSSSVLNVRTSFLTLFADRQVTCKKIKRKWKRLMKNIGKSLKNEVSYFHLGN